MQYSRDRGFGFLEVLIVAAIIAIAVIVVINQFGHVRARNTMELCHKNMKAMEWAEKLYYREHQSYTTNLDELEKYIEHIDELNCPTDQSPYEIELTEFGFAVMEGGPGNHGSITDGVPSWEKTAFHEEASSLDEELSEGDSLAAGEDVEEEPGGGVEEEEEPAQSVEVKEEETN